MLHGTGWIPDVPSARDYSSRSPKVQPLLARLQSSKTGPRPIRVDLERYFPRVENQGPVQSCTAHAGAALLEYFYRKAIGQSIGPVGNASRMFPYKVTRNLLNRPNADAGGFLRTTMEAMRLIGVPPEDAWPYVAESLYLAGYGKTSFVGKFLLRVPIPTSGERSNQAGKVRREVLPL